ILSFMSYFLFFFLHHPATSEIYTLSLHALFRSRSGIVDTIQSFDRSDSFRNRNRHLDLELFARICRNERIVSNVATIVSDDLLRSEEHTSELQSRENLVCRLLLEKKKKKKYIYY